MSRNLAAETRGYTSLKPLPRTVRLAKGKPQAPKGMVRREDYERRQAEQAFARAR